MCHIFKDNLTIRVNLASPGDFFQVSSSSEWHHLRDLTRYVMHRLSMEQELSAQICWALEEGFAAKQLKDSRSVCDDLSKFWSRICGKIERYKYCLCRSIEILKQNWRQNTWKILAFLRRSVEEVGLKSRKDHGSGKKVYRMEKRLYRPVEYWSREETTALRACNSENCWYTPVHFRSKL